MYFPTLGSRDRQAAPPRMAPLRMRRFRLEHAAAPDRAWLRDTLDRECRRFGGRVAMRERTLVLGWA